MKLVSINISLSRRDELISYLQDDLNIKSLKVITGENFLQIQLYINKRRIQNLLHKLDKIGCGVTYGEISIVSVDLVKPLVKDNNNLMLWHYDKLSSEEIYDTISSSCSLTFNYIGYLIISSLIAGIGLSTNNTVMIVSSMLLSPLMGPLLGLSYGTIISDKLLFKEGLKNELIGILISFMVGVIIGLAYYKFSDNFNWPTEEMRFRGEDVNLLVGLAFAIPAGFGVGISVTLGGINSLVGVAIASSLLPPLVNSICLSYGFLVDEWIDSDIDRDLFLDTSRNSFFLFFINLLIIYLESVLVFKIKGVTKFRKKSVMWTDIPPVDIERKDSIKSLRRGSSRCRSSDNLLNLFYSTDNVDKEEYIEKDKLLYYKEKEIKKLIKSNIRERHLLRIFLKRYKFIKRLQYIDNIILNNKRKMDILRFFLLLKLKK